MNLSAAVGFIMMLIVRGRRAVLFSPNKWRVLHYVTTLYFIAVTASLLAAEAIYDNTPFRLLVTGILVFWISQEIRPTQREKALFLHVLGSVAVLVSFLSLLQTVFPSFMNSFADKYLMGRAAYGLAIEFDRGRLLHWGALIFIFPFFYSSSLLLRWRSRVWVALYVVTGYLVILASMVVSNFRWIFLVFLVTSALYVVHGKRFHLISAQRLSYIFSLFIVAIVAGLIWARLVLGYNLVDRFLLRNAHRDITETSGRITLYSQALTAFGAYPVFGAGYGNYYAVVWPFPHLQYFAIFDQFEPIPVPIASHNEFYTVLAETGMVGFLFFLLTIYFIGKLARARLFGRFMSHTDRLLALTVWISYVAVFLYIWFENIYPQNIAYILLLGGIVTKWIDSSPTYEEGKY